MLSINPMRSKYLFETFENTNFGNNIIPIINKILRNEPTYSDKFECCNCYYSENKTFPTVGINASVFRDDFSKLQDSILNNILEETKCPHCDKIAQHIHDFNHHIFVEVAILFIIHVYFLYVQ